MSSTGAIPKGGARPKFDIKKENVSTEQKKEDTDVQDEPLDQKFITVSTKGVDRKVPALHKGWATRGTYIKYVPPPLPEQDGSYLQGALESWLEQMELLEEDFRHLLELPHNRFWSQMVYDPAVHECLENFLSIAPRWYEGHLVDPQCQPLLHTLHRHIFLLYLRLATYKESKTCHITPTVFADIIYENYIFDICKLLDLCALYAPSNGQLLSRMIGNIFKHQPKYYDDLTQSMSSISLALERVEDKLGVAEYNVPVALNTTCEHLSTTDLEDIVLFLLDTFSSLQMFLTLHPPAAEHFHQATFHIRIATFYEKVFPTLVNCIAENCKNTELEAELCKQLQVTRSLVLMTVRAVLHHKCLRPLQQDKPSSTVVGECVEEFLHVMSSCIGEKTFISDYCTAHPISLDLQCFEQHGGDTTSLSFIQEAVSTVLSEMGVQAEGKDNFRPPTEARQPSLPTPPLTQPADATPQVPDVSGMNGYAQVGSAAPTDMEVAMMVSSVQDLLPGLGAGFIQQCLKYYSYSTEEVINAVLVDSLPQCLASLDRTAPISQQESKPLPSPPPATDHSESTQQTPYLDRPNVYDNDEFDVFHKTEVDRSRIHKGKRKENNFNYQVDEDSKEKLKEIARHYEERGGTSIYEDEFRYEGEEEQTFKAWDYDDEYDDTYDDNETGDIDNTGVEKVVRRRPGIIGAGRLNAPINYASASSEEEAEAGEDNTQPAINGANTADQQSQKPQRGQPSVRPKSSNKNSTRGVQRVFTNSKSSKPSSKQHTPTPEREESQDVRVQDAGRTQEPRDAPRTEMRPFCENPEVTRQRAEQRRQDRDRNRGYRGRGAPAREGTMTNGVEGGPEGQGGPRHKTVYASRNTGKGWRNAPPDADGRGGSHGGKFKEDSNHGKAQSLDHRHKMMHKNEHKRQGAQAKFNRNN